MPKAKRGRGARTAPTRVSTRNKKTTSQPVQREAEEEAKSNIEEEEKVEPVVPATIVQDKYFESREQTQLPPTSIPSPQPPSPEPELIEASTVAYHSNSDTEEEDGDESSYFDKLDAEAQDAINKEIREECHKYFSSLDFIMEPDIINQLKRYFQAGGNPEEVVTLLSENYHGIAQTVNLLAEWLIMTGMKICEVQSLVEDHLKQMIMKRFDPKKADSIFADEAIKTPIWLTEMIEHPTWRSLIYRLAEDYPDCLMLTFTIKLISDAGFQGEITSISTASQQLEVFARILKNSVNNFLDGGEDDMKKQIDEFTKMVCHSEHTFLYSCAILHVLSQENKGGTIVKRLLQEVTQRASKDGHNATPVLVALNGAWAHQRVTQALAAMLSKNNLNPADITVLAKAYQAPDPPPVDLLRIPQFLDLLLTIIFRPTSKINPEHKPKYIYLLAYATSVHETWKKGVRKTINKEELKPTNQAIEKVNILSNEKKGSSELLPELNTLYQCIRFPVVALGIIEWVKYLVSERNYFQLSTEHTPLHLALLDEVATCHTTLHNKVLDLLIHLFESPHEDLDVLVQLEVKKMLIDRMVHVLSRGCVVPVVNYMKTCWQKQATDVSLIRYFVTEVLDVISPPYTPAFIQIFLPLVENEEITGNMRKEHESTLVSQFIIEAGGT
ncbi:negative elongation factor C/D [Tetranychus urticae]|nr:negative elongation factor C/D [Tetranychus urticae]